MNNTLKIAYIQNNLFWENPEENRKVFAEKILGLDPVDLVVLPEMFTTGFTMNAEALSETMEGETVSWMLSLAHKKQAAITGSIIIKEDQKYYNRMLFVFPNKTIEYYDKRHSFSLAGEDKVYTAGEQQVLVNYRGFSISLQVCYDLRFPVWARNTQNYDVLIYVANWPEKRVAAWDALLKARAIENMAYCIGVNRVGVDGMGFQYVGHSAVYNALGDIVSSSGHNQEAVSYATLSKNHIEKTRRALPFLNDKDSFTLL